MEGGDIAGMHVAMPGLAFIVFCNTNPSMALDFNPCMPALQAPSSLLLSDACFFGIFC